MCWVLWDFLGGGKGINSGVGTGFGGRLSASWKQLVRQICRDTAKFVLFEGDNL